MPKIRLNKAVKEFNISMSRLVEFLQSRGFEVESNPNAQLEEAAYAALEAEFARDSEQRKASHEVVISKVPEEKLEIEPKKPEVIKAKAPSIGEARVLGKIELEKPKAEVPAVEPVIAPEEPKKEEIKKEEPKKEEPVELKVLDKIDLSKIESNKPKPSPKKEEKPKQEAPKFEKKELPKPEVKKEQPKAPVKEETTSVKFDEPEKIKTVYQKLGSKNCLYRENRPFSVPNETF